ncbi:MAG: hypothetical protein ACRD2N_15565 [Vicinamibacterales bacterium]
MRDRVQALIQNAQRRGPDVESRARRPLDLLSDVLTRLQVNIDSQMLVFSKTSVQATRVSPEHPRAIYFGDDVAVAYVPDASTLEIAAVDPVQGPVFYTMSLDATATIARGTSCLQCHHGPNTAGIPGLYVGSVIPGPTGMPLHGESAIITDHRSDFRDRWGGWYVTARRGEQPDRANAVATSPAEPETLVREARQNLADLTGRFKADGYPTLTSDIVALMTFEHQTQMTNRLTRVGWEARIAAHEGRRDIFADQSLATDLEDLVSYMLFEGEAPITEPIEGVSTFTQSFAARGPRDRRGRSLRDFDLRTRLFRYPLSYMIYSEAFDALPEVVRDRLYRRLFEVLSGQDRSARFGHLSTEDRGAIMEILRETKRSLPSSWRTSQRAR